MDTKAARQRMPKMGQGKRRVKTEHMSVSGSEAESTADMEGKRGKHNKVTDEFSAKNSAAKSNAGKGKTVTKDKVTVYMEKTTAGFRRDIATPVTTLQRAIRDIRNSVVSGKYKENEEAFVAKMRKIDEDAGGLPSALGNHEGRLQAQARLVARQGKAKSSGRREAGKSKAAALGQWQQEVKAASEALKKEGYQGSLNLKKSGHLYSKILELRGAPGASSSAVSPTGSAGGARGREYKGE